jgi:hypothetical protein
MPHAAASSPGLPRDVTGTNAQSGFWNYPVMPNTRINVMIFRVNGQTTQRNMMKPATNFTRRFLALTAAFSALASQAIPINFGQSDQTGDELFVGGATITGSSWTGLSGQPTTVQGLGLGSSTIGAGSSIDRQLHFSAGSFSPDLDLSEGLSLSVNGRINSVTLVPEFTVVGTGEIIDLPFQAMLIPLAHTPGLPGTGPLMPNWITFNPSDSAGITYTGLFGSDNISSFTINLTQAGDPVIGLYSFLEDRGFSDVTVQYSVRITSLDYSPSIASVPEPTAFSLMGLGLLALGWKRRPRTNA